MKRALLHVSLPFSLLIALSTTHVFEGVQVELSYDHYAEEKVDYLPSFLAMPCNCLVNLAYIYTGLYWLLWRGGGAWETHLDLYLRQVFAFMAILYAPVQWTRLAVLGRAPAVLDQWCTLPIFAWVPVWIDAVERRTMRARQAAALELLSLLSYGLALVHELGFEFALGCHVACAVYKAVRVQRLLGDGRSRRYLLLAVLSCSGFVGLKLLDHWLARYWLFQRFTGHFWSKVCDALQFHYSFCFLTALSQRKMETHRE